MELKDFDSWNDFKKNLDKADTSSTFFYEREVWICSIGVNVGSEQDARNASYSRPVLVLKKCNSRTFIGIPLTSKEPKGQDRRSVDINGASSTVIISQIRLFDRNRLLRKYGYINQDEWTKLKKEAREYLGLA